MKRCNLYFIETLKSNYCKIVYFLSIILIYFLTPKKVFYGWYMLIGIIFILISALVITCFIRNIKEKVILAKTQATSTLGLLSAVIGLAALQVCGVGAPICGASIGAGFLSLLLPGFSLNFFESYALHIIIISIVLQILALHMMNCFKRIRGKC